MSWWRNAVWYEVFVPSFADGNGDGLGDLAGVRDRLAYIRKLGVDAVWLTPFYPSPMVDAGYDVADYCDVDSRMGTLDGFDALLAEAHQLGLRIAVDIVPNHTSDRHPWFRQALSSPPGSPARARYHFARGRHGGREPPNNWRSSVGGGSAWTRIDGGEWYLHLFTPSQPDLNWRNPDVHRMFDDVLRFWLGRGVDGIRIDVAYGMYKQADLADDPGPFDTEVFGVGPERRNSFNRPEVLGVHAHWRELLDSYDEQKAAVGELWLRSDYDIADYAARLHQVFNVKLMRAGWSAHHVKQVVDETVTTMRAAGAAPTWVIGNHDVQRIAARYGGGEVGRRRAVAATLLQLALPGSSYLYAGDELALPAAFVPPERRRDPVWELSGHRQTGRDPWRVPMPWRGASPPYGFSDGAHPWLPQPTDWGALTVAAQQRDVTSPLSVIRRALRARRRCPAPSGPLVWQDAPPGCLALGRGEHAEAMTCLVNFSDSAVDLPDGEVLVASTPVDDGRLPGNSAVWLSGSHGR